MQRNLPDRTLGAAICVAAILVAGCASAPPAQAPAIDRISGAALEAKLPAPAAEIGLEDIVAMSKRGETAARVIGKIDESHSHYRLNAHAIVELSQKGVDLAVLDHMIEAERQRIFTDMATEISQRDQACLDRVEREVRQCRLQSMPYWPAQPFATCWPPHAGFPYWRCF